MSWEVALKLAGKFEGAMAAMCGGETELESGFKKLTM